MPSKKNCNKKWFSINHCRIIFWNIHQTQWKRSKMSENFFFVPRNEIPYLPQFSPKTSPCNSSICNGTRSWNYKKGKNNHRKIYCGKKSVWSNWRRNIKNYTHDKVHNSSILLGFSVRRLIFLVQTTRLVQ